jgi:hypothetical protein
VCRASLTPGEDGVVLAGDQQAAWPGAIAPSENRAYAHDPAVLFKSHPASLKNKEEKWAGKNRS